MIARPNFADEKPDKKRKDFFPNVTPELMTIDMTCSKERSKEFLESEEGGNLDGKVDGDSDEAKRARVMETM